MVTLGQLRRQFGQWEIQFCDNVANGEGPNGIDIDDAPRAVNNLAVHALTAAFAAKSAIVDEKAARIADIESGND